MRVTGKTNRDERSGSKRRNATNKAKRASWSKSLRKPPAMPFPSETCNGKRNRLAR